MGMRRPRVRADGLRGLAGRGRSDPRVPSGLDTIGDQIPASGRYTLMLFASLEAYMTPNTQRLATAMCCRVSTMTEQREYRNVSCVVCTTR